MTRNEFIENVTCFSELIDFCSETGSSICDDLYYYESLNDAILDDLREDPPSDWCSLRDCLNGIPESPYWYVRNGWLDYEGVDELFEDYKRRVLEEADYDGDFDPDPDDEEEDEEYQEEEAPAEQDDNFTEFPVENLSHVMADSFAVSVVVIHRRQDQEDSLRDAASGAIQIITQ